MIVGTVASAAVSTLRQSDVIFGTIVLAFIIYITAKGELPKYIQVFI